MASGRNERCSIRTITVVSGFRGIRLGAWLRCLAGEKKERTEDPGISDTVESSDAGFSGSDRRVASI